MADDELKGFKVGENYREGMSAPAERAGAEVENEQPPAASLGFTRIEAMLEKTSPEEFIRRLDELQVALNAVQQESAPPKRKAAAHKAGEAAAKTKELLEYLVQVRAQLQEAMSSQ